MHLSPSLPYRPYHTLHNDSTISKPGNWHRYNPPCLFTFHQFTSAHLGMFIDSDKVSWLHFSDLYSCLDIFLAIHLLYKFLKKVFSKFVNGLRNVYYQKVLVLVIIKIQDLESKSHIALFRYCLVLLLFIICV